MLNINISDKTKHILTTFFIFFGMIVGMVIILISFTFLSRNSWKNSLAVEIQRVLDSYPEGQYTVGKNLQLDSAFSTSAAVYSLLKKDERRNEKYYGVIVRVPSVLGPLPAVFIYSSTYGVSFVGYAVDNGKAADIVDKRISSSTIKYWENLVPEIISKIH